MTRALPAAASRMHPAPSSSAMLTGLGLACPEISDEQTNLAERLACAWNLAGPAARRWRRIIESTGIERRHAVLPVESVVKLTTEQRMAAYDMHAPTLAAEAARRAMRNAGIAPDDVTDLIVVSCTGFSAPGVDVGLIDRLGLPTDVRRTIIGFMGCYGGIIGLRQAMQTCRAERAATALVVSVELCSLHFRQSPDADNLVASALFADGAAAAVVQSQSTTHVHSRHAPTAADALHADTPIEIVSARSRLLPEGRSWMTWRITDTGFAMTLARTVPEALGRYLADLFPAPLDRPLRLGVHPGGPGILDAARDALPMIDPHAMAVSKDVLRRCGNMSSATILFVLHGMLSTPSAGPLHLVAFGPGLTVETLTLEVGQCLVATRCENRKS